MYVAEPNVQLLAHTTIVPDSIEQNMQIQEGSTDAETLTVYSGRSCFESWNRPNPKTRDDKDYLIRTLFEQGHMSILEHASATLRITGVSRALLAELTRHRHLSFSVRSQRFVSEEDAAIVLPPAIDGTTDASTLENAAETALREYEKLVVGLQDKGLPRKQAREAARAVLPNMVETRMVVTGNHRAWVETLHKRLAPGADAEFQQVAKLMLDTLYPTAPAIYEHLKENH